MGIDILHRKESLILTAVDVIQELGIQGLTTREIAKRQKVSEATIFRHYKNKNELLLAVLDYYIQFDADILQSIRLADREPLDAIRFFVMEHAEYYNNYPAITAITQIYDVLRHEKDLAGKITDIRDNRTEVLKGLIETAQNAGKINKDYDSLMLAVMVLGFVREACLNWRIDNYSYSLRDKIQASLDSFLEAFKG